MRMFLTGGGEDVGSGLGEAVADCSGDMDGEGDSSAVGEGDSIGDSCATAIWAEVTKTGPATNVRSRSLSIIPPVYIWKNVVAPLAVAQESFIEAAGDKLIVQRVEAIKMIERLFRGVFARRSSLHQKRPITRLCQQKFAGELFEYAIDM